MHVALPYSIFGVICLQAAIFGSFLPETKGKATMETMGDLKAKETEKGITLHVFPDVKANEDEKRTCVEKELTKNLLD